MNERAASILWAEVKKSEALLTERRDRVRSAERALGDRRKELWGTEARIRELRATLKGLGHA